MAEIEYFYAAYSGYAYLGSRKFLEIVEQGSHTIKHKPFDLRVSMTEIGGNLWVTEQKII